MPKILCPCHQDNTPSMETYPDSLYCWVCRTRLTYDEYYKLTGALLRNEVAPPVKPREDITASMKYIHSLPIANIRGLSFPTDDQGYYIVWPQGNYYKRRNFSELGPRYLGPSGHRSPLLVVNKGKGDTLLIVEGELNALSVGQACHEFGVCSPGSAGDFGKKEYLEFYTQYRRQIILIDEDDAGALGAITLSALLRPVSNDVQIIMFKKQAKGGPGDANEILQEKGRQTLRETVFSRIGTSLVRTM